MIRQVVAIAFLAFFPLWSLAQDSARLLTYESFLERVATYHPTAQRADLILERADQQMLSARGAFDPKLEGGLSQKVFKETNYYRYLDGGIKWPTRLGGLTFKAGYESASGQYQNPDANTPAEGLLNAGVMLPLGQGLLIDPARARFRQAQVDLDAAPVDRQVVLNDLLFDAAFMYWDWAEANGRAEILERATQVANTRLEWIRNTAMAGDLPTIDTLKAGIQVQNRRLERDQALLEVQQTRVHLQVFLWEEGRQPWAEETEFIPQLPVSRTDVIPPPSDSFDILMDPLFLNHPALVSLQYDLAWLEIERRMKAEKLKPKVNVEYAALNEPIFGTGGSQIDPRLFMDNYKWGFTVSFPIFLREARGDLGLTRIKIQETQWKQQEKQQKILAYARYYAQQMQGLYDQMILSRQNVANYRDLLAAEQWKFEVGESSVFEINIWETQLIEAELKLLSLQTKYAKTLAAFQWALGALAER